MALLKCPDCGHIVSEHALFCVGCGCDIKYILKYYQNQKQREFSKKNENRTLYDSLDNKQKYFIDKTRSELNNNGIVFYFENTTKTVGFRKNEKGRLLAFLSKTKAGKIDINLFSHKLNRCQSSTFDANKVKEYISYVTDKLFFKEEQLTSYHEKDFSFYKNKYKYTIRDNKVEKIEISEITLVNNKYRVYFVYEDGTRKFCSFDNLKNILFDSKYKAEKTIKKDGNDNSIQPNKKYVIMDKTTNQYFKGTHHTNVHESYRVKRGKNMSSFTIVEVPDFTTNLEKAVIFFSFDSAQKVVEQIQEVSGKLTVIELK